MAERVDTEIEPRIARMTRILLVPKLHLGTHVSAKFNFADRSRSQVQLGNEATTETEQNEETI